MSTNPESAAVEAVAWPERMVNLPFPDGSSDRIVGFRIPEGHPALGKHGLSEPIAWLKQVTIEQASALDALRGEVERLHVQIDTFMDKWVAEIRRAGAAERRVAELEAVLRPLADATFAEFCGVGTEAFEPDDSKVSYPEDRCHITFGMIRNARKALTKESP